MRSDQVRELFEAHFQGDDAKVRMIANEVILEEEAKNHRRFADDLRCILDSERNDAPKRIVGSSSIKSSMPIPRDDSKGFPLLEIRHEYHSLNDLILRREVLDELSTIVAENKAQSILASYGLKPRNRLLFYGEPGTGKTLATRVMSTMTNLPLIYVRFDSIISSYLGETATNLRKVFNFIENGRYVVLFDEFDFIAKKRDDPHEHGEIKRVVNNFIQMLDSYNGPSILIAATNHQYLLDSAVWRRFDDAVFFELPDSDLRAVLFSKYLSPIVKDERVRISIDDYAQRTEGFSPSDIQTTCENALRKSIINRRINIVHEDIIQAINRHIQRKDLVMRA